MRLTPRNQIAGDRDSIPTMASVNSLLTAATSLFAASWHITNNVSRISAQHASVVSSSSPEGYPVFDQLWFELRRTIPRIQVRSAPQTLQCPAAINVWAEVGISSV